MNVGNFNEIECLQAITSSTLRNERDLLALWAGDTNSGSESNLDILKKIAVANGANAVGNFSETDCLRSIARSKGAKIPGAMSDLDCLKGIASNVFPPYPPPSPDSPQSLTNAQKLSLPENTPVGKVVSVTNGFVVSGLGDSRDGFYFDSGTIQDGNPFYVHAGYTGADNDWYVKHTALDNGDGWTLGSASGSNSDTHSAIAPTFGSFPWEFSWTDSTAGVITLTHPAIQTLTAPSTAQGGVFVAGGTRDGVYPKSEASNAGKDYFVLLGVDDDPTNGAITWWNNINDQFGIGPSSAGFAIEDANGAGPIYYSNSDVATPDLASNWKNASDDSPASITVTSVSVGELNAGVTVAAAGSGAANGVFPVNGNLAGRNQFSRLGAALDLNWDAPDGGIWQFGSSYYNSTDNVAFPYQATFMEQDGSAPAPTVTRNDVASEANWSTL